MQLRCESAYKERSPALLDLRKRPLYVRCNESSSTRGNVRSGSQPEELRTSKTSQLCPRKRTLAYPLPMSQGHKRSCAPFQG